MESRTASELLGSLGTLRGPDSPLLFDRAALARRSRITRGPQLLLGPMRFRPVFLDKLGTSVECTDTLTYSTASMARAAQGVSVPFRQEADIRTSRCVKRGRSQFLPLVRWELGLGIPTKPGTQFHGCSAVRSRRRSAAGYLTVLKNNFAGTQAAQMSEGPPLTYFSRSRGTCDVTSAVRRSVRGGARRRAI